MTRVFSTIFSGLLWASLPAFAGTSAETEAEFARAQNSYFKALTEGKSGAELKKVRTETIDATQQKLSTPPPPPPVSRKKEWGLSPSEISALEEKISHEKPEVLRGAEEALNNPPPEFKEKSKASKNVASKAPGAGAAGALVNLPNVPSLVEEPRPEVKVEGVESKTTLEFKPRGKVAPAPKRTQAAAEKGFELIGTKNEGGVSALEFKAPPSTGASASKPAQKK